MAGHWVRVGNMYKESYTSKDLLDVKSVNRQCYYDIVKLDD